jgi:hypothetical protein
MNQQHHDNLVTALKDAVHEMPDADETTIDFEELANVAASVIESDMSGYE